MYRALGSRWMDAVAWARRHQLPVTLRNERCFRAPDRRATRYYADAEGIVEAYRVIGTPRLTDDAL